jgi:hypothetical protein
MTIVWIYFVKLSRGKTHELKPIARGMTRFSIPRLLNWSSSTSEGVIELFALVVRAPSLASNLGRLDDESERKIYQCAGEIVALPQSCRHYLKNSLNLYNHSAAY